MVCGTSFKYFQKDYPMFYVNLQDTKYVFHTMVHVNGTVKIFFRVPRLKGGLTYFSGKSDYC